MQNIRQFSLKGPQLMYAGHVYADFPFVREFRQTNESAIFVEFCDTIIKTPCQLRTRHVVNVNYPHL